jgi:hypothetical protein
MRPGWSAPELAMAGANGGSASAWPGSHSCQVVSVCRQISLSCRPSTPIESPASVMMYFRTVPSR